MTLLAVNFDQEEAVARRLHLELGTQAGAELRSTAAAAAIRDGRFNDIAERQRAKRASTVFSVRGERIRERIKLLQSLYFQRGYLPELNRL